MAIEAEANRRGMRTFVGSLRNDHERKRGCQNSYMFYRNQALSLRHRDSERISFVTWLISLKWFILVYLRWCRAASKHSSVPGPALLVSSTSLDGARTRPELSAPQPPTGTIADVSITYQKTFHIWESKPHVTKFCTTRNGVYIRIEKNIILHNPSVR